MSLFFFLPPPALLEHFKYQAELLKAKLKPKVLKMQYSTNHAHAGTPGVVSSPAMTPSSELNHKDLAEWGP